MKTHFVMMANYNEWANARLFRAAARRLSRSNGIRGTLVRKFCTRLPVAVQSPACLCLYFYSAGFLRSNSFQNVRKILLLF
jgi:hypothetical protein